MTLIAGTASTGPTGTPGAAGGTLKIAAGTVITVTGPGGISPVNITYNPTSYTAPTNYAGFFATGNGAPFSQFMLVYPSGADKPFDGTTAANFTSFKPDINGVVPGGGGLTLTGGGTANFDTAAAGVNKPISFSGFTLGGASAGFALPTGCCGEVTRTTGTITPVAIPVAPAIVPPAIVALPPDAVGLPATVLLPVLLPVFYPYTVLAGMDLAVEGIRMPPVEAPPPPPPVVVPPPPPAPPVVVPPVLPPRPTRN